MSFGFSVEGKVKSGKPTTFPSPCQRPPSLPDLSHWTVPNNFFEEIALQGAVFYENQIPIYPYPSIQAKNEERPPPLPPETLLATALSSEISRPSQSQVPLTIAEQQPTRAGHRDIQILEGEHTNDDLLLLPADKQNDLDPALIFVDSMLCIRFQCFVPIFYVPVLMLYFLE